MMVSLSLFTSHSSLLHFVCTDTLNSGWCPVTDDLDQRLKYAPTTPSPPWGAFHGWEHLVDGKSQAEVVRKRGGACLPFASPCSQPLCQAFPWRRLRAHRRWSHTAQVQILLLPLWPWARFLVSLRLSFPIWKMAVIIVLTSAKLLLTPSETVYVQQLNIMLDTEWMIVKDVISSLSCPRVLIALEK